MKPYMAKKAIESGTQGWKNKVLKRQIDKCARWTKVRSPIQASGDQVFRPAFKSFRCWKRKSSEIQHGEGIGKKNVYLL